MANQQVAALDDIDDPFLDQLGIRLSVLRLDSLDGNASGNKIFKLKHNIDYARAHGYRQVASFGGAYSNHIHALAMAGRAAGLETIGFIRGEPHQPLNATLHDAVAAGMALHYMSRTEYRRRDDPALLAQLQRAFPDAYFIPEGGSNRFGVEGCMDIVRHIDYRCAEEVDVIALPCGTAATLAGVAAAASGKQVWGFPVLKGGRYLEAEVRRFQSELAVGVTTNWTLFDDYHCGGYAKMTPSLVAFMDDFEKKFNIPVEPVYSGKMLYGLYQLLMQQSSRLMLPSGARIVAVHTGGLQGLRGMQPTLQAMRSSAHG